MSAFDLHLFRTINQAPEWLNPIMQFFSEGSKWTVVRIFLVAVIIAMMTKPRSRRAALTALAAWPLANLVTDVLKFSFMDLRPSDPRTGLLDVICRVEPLTSFGTASAHSANMAAVAFVMTYVLGRWGAPWVAVALLTGLSRVYVGVHFPHQVLLGWFVGVFCAWLVLKTFEAAQAEIDRRNNRRIE